MRTGQQKQFILNYLANHIETSVTDEEFHDEFYKRFGGNRKLTHFGAQPVYKAMRLLEYMYRQKLINRGIMGLTEHEIGFPNWCYTYYLE